MLEQVFLGLMPSWSRLGPGYWITKMFLWKLYRYWFGWFPDLYALLISGLISLNKITASQVGLDAPSCTALCCMLSNSWRSGRILQPAAKFCHHYVFFFSDKGYCSGSLCIGKRGVMFLRDFLLIQIGQLIMGIGYGSPALHFSTRCGSHLLLNHLFDMVV